MQVSMVSSDSIVLLGSIRRPLALNACFDAIVDAGIVSISRVTVESIVNIVSNDFHYAKRSKDLFHHPGLEQDRSLGTLLIH